MKKIRTSIIASMISFAIPVLAQTPSPQFLCTNDMFRQAVLELSETRFVIQDSYIDGEGLLLRESVVSLSHKSRALLFS